MPLEGAEVDTILPCWHGVRHPCLARQKTFPTALALQAMGSDDARDAPYSGISRRPAMEQQRRSRPPPKKR